MNRAKDEAIGKRVGRSGVATGALGLAALKRPRESSPGQGGTDNGSSRASRLSQIWRVSQEEIPRKLVFCLQFARSSLTMAGGCLTIRLVANCLGVQRPQLKTPGPQASP